MTIRRTIPIFLLLLALTGTAFTAQAQNIAGTYDVQVRGTTVYTDRSPAQTSISDETTMEITQTGDRITVEFGSFASAMSRTRFEGTVGNDRFTAIWWTSSQEDEARVIWGRVSNGQLRGRLLYPRAANRRGLVPGWTEIRFSARKQEPVAAVEEDCIGFDGSTLEVRRDDDGYLLTDGRSRMMTFDNRSEALRAKQTLEAYDLNQQCFVGRPDPSMQYFLSSESAPSGARPDEDCISFNPSSLTLKREGSRYLIQSNRSRMKMVDSKSEGETIIAVIKKHGFTNTCYIGRPDPSMTYYRK